MPRFEAHFMPCFEIGWRLPRACWGQGYATEAAKAVVDFAFHQVQIEDLVAFTFTGNDASRKVMAKLGMTYDEADDFPHPLLTADHPLRHHVLYRLSRQAWTDAA
jgi:ribosomal-protein-alanine N-acetyltransferase